MRDTVVVIISAKNCSACKSFRASWPTFKDDIERQLQVKVVDVHLEMMNSPIDTSQYPTGLSVYKRWFPMFLLVRGKVWESAMLNKGFDIPLNATIMGGSMVNGIPTMGQGFPLKNDLVLKLLDEKIKELESSSVETSVVVNPIISLPTSGRVSEMGRCETTTYKRIT